MSQITLPAHDDIKALLLYASALPTHESLHYRLGSYYAITMYDYEKALFYLKKLHKINPQHIDCLATIADCLYYQNKFKEATTFFKKIEKHRVLTENEMRMASWAFQKVQKYKEAVVYYEVLHQQSPHDTNLLINMGYCYGKLDNSDKALTCSLLANKINPNDYTALLNIGFRYWATQDLKQARLYTEKALKSYNDYSYALMNMGHICWCEGDKIAGIKYYQKSKSSLKHDTKFEELMMEDAKYIWQYGITEAEFIETLQGL